MKLSRLLILCWAVVSAAPAFAKLPAPTPEEAARKTAAAEKKARDEEAAKAALARAQNRVVQRYHAAHPPLVKKPAQQDAAEAMPESNAEIEE